MESNVSFQDALVARTKLFRDAIEDLVFSFDGVTYDPLAYAWDAHEQYLRRYVHQGVPVFFLGMNPGPFGMAQTGVPFGEINAVRNWLSIDGYIGKPVVEHPGRPVLGYQTVRSEVSGKRFWGLMEQRYGSAKSFFETNCVMNYCPLVFLDAGARAKNITPDKLPKPERLALEGVCDAYLSDVLAMVGSPMWIGIGKYAQDKLQRMLPQVGGEHTVGVILHPSPGNPQANDDWSGKVARSLLQMGAWS